MDALNGSGVVRLMNEGVTDIADPEKLTAEVGRLRGEVARLTQRIEQLDQLAHQDSLVNLPNRRGFLRELDRLIARTTRYNTSAALLYIDLDGLKIINDSFGHRAGDEALVEVARQLEKGLRRSDVVARIGGDEFGVLLENCDEQRARDTALRLTNCIGDHEFCHEEACLPLSVAIGVAMIQPGDTAADVMARADEEMYRQKAA